MREARLKGCPKRRFRVGARPAPTKVANLLNQDFSASAANQRWASDITYLWTTQGWLYLAVVMDLYSRRIIGWSMHRRIDRALALAALDMALGQRQPTSELIHQSTPHTIAEPLHDGKHDGMSGLKDLLDCVKHLWRNRRRVSRVISDHDSSTFCWFHLLKP
jgi:transposase InsO family protein